MRFMMFKCFSMCSNIYTLEKEMKWTTSAIVCLMEFYTQTWCHLNPISENYSQTLELVKTQILAIDLSRAFFTADVVGYQSEWFFKNGNCFLLILGIGTKMDWVEKVSQMITRVQTEEKVCERRKDTIKVVFTFTCLIINTKIYISRSSEP